MSKEVRGMMPMELPDMDYGNTEEKTARGFAKVKTGKKKQISPYIAESRHQKVHLYALTHKKEVGSVKNVVIDLIDQMDEILPQYEGKEYDSRGSEEKRQLSVMIPEEQYEKLLRHKIQTRQSVPKVISLLIDSLPEEV